MQIPSFLIFYIENIRSNKVYCKRRKITTKIFDIKEIGRLPEPERRNDIIEEIST